MQVDKRSLTTAKGAKDYLSRNEIPQLFECLMTGLMYHRPTDYILYLQDCLERIKKQGVKGVRWDLFLDARSSPLPPITGTPREKGAAPLPNVSPVPSVEDPRPRPLPEIGTIQLRMDPQASVVIVQGGPGVDKNGLCKHLCASFPSFVHISLGTLLRQRALEEARDPGSRWRTVREYIDKGDLVSEEFVLESLVKALNDHEGEINFLIEGYPRTTKQREDFEKMIGLSRVKFMLLVDCEEDVCQKNLMIRAPDADWKDHGPSAVEKRIFNYMKNSLAVCKHFDDHRKLMVVDGDKGRDLVLKDIHRIFLKEFSEMIVPHPPMSPKEPLSPDLPIDVPKSQARETGPGILKLSEIYPEEERNFDLPQCQLMLLLGGPGSGKSEVAAHLCSLHPSWVHVDVNEILRQKVLESDFPDQDLAFSNDNHPFVENWTISISALKDAIKSVPEGTEVIILEGFPRDSDQLNQFNVEIGRADFAVLLDCEEDEMRTRLEERFFKGQKAEDDDNMREMRIGHFKDVGLSICRYYDESHKMLIVAGDRDMVSVAEDVEKIVGQKLQSTVAETEDAPRVSQEEEDSRADAAATKIQASIRGHITRKRLNEKASENQDKSAVVDEEEQIELVETVKEGEDAVHQGEEVDDVVEDNEAPEKEEVVDKVEHEPKEVEGDVEVEVDVEVEGDVEVEVDAEVEGDAEVEEKIELTEGILLGVNVFSIPTSVGRTKEIVLLLGGPGSGKRTLGNQVANKFDVSFLHVDQMVTDALQLGSDDSEELNKYLKGEECDEIPLFSLLRKEVDASPSRIVLIAGFPRTVEQYQKFTTMVGRVSATIFLDVDDDTLKGRLSSSEDSDALGTFDSKFSAFKESSGPLLEELSESGNLTKVDGTQEVVDVFQQVSEVVENFHFTDSEE